MIPFNPEEGLELLGELVRAAAPPAGEEEICDRGVAITARAVGASAGLILLFGPPRVHTATWGSGPFEEMLLSAKRESPSVDLAEQGAAPDGVPRRVAFALPLQGKAGSVGRLVLERPSLWGPPARAFAQTAARLLASALESVRILRQSRLQGELLAGRNVELETLRELTARLQELVGEEEMLQSALDLVLEKMDLSAGWVFWGESEQGELRLAASRGVAEEFVHESRERGVGQCLCHEVFTSGRSMIARNTLDCPRLPRLVSANQPATHACIPLKFQRGVVGVLNIAAREGRLFSEQELQFLETFGNQVCLAVDRAQTMLAEMRRNAEARALVTLARAIGGSLELERVLTAVGDYARELLGADRCAILLGESASKPLVLAHLSGPPLGGLEKGRPVDLVALGSRAVAGALRLKKTHVIQDALNDPRVNRDLAMRWSVASQILVPLVARDRLEGVLAVTRSFASSWTPEEVALADGLGGQAAVAIENARLYREAQESLRKLQDAQVGLLRAERLATLGTLASSLAHEVRNPLNSISLQLVLLSRRVRALDAGVQDELRELLGTARGEIARLNELVEEFLSMSSLDRLSLEELHPRDVVQEVLDLLVPLAREKGLRVDVSIPQRLPRVPMDRQKIKQVLQNLVRNAIEAMPDGGTLGVAVSRSEDGVVIRVSDTGAGIPPGLDVFDFFLTTKRGGTGLGLPISRRIVEVHGGALSYESEPGRGTVFSVTLRGGRSGDAGHGARKG